MDKERYFLTFPLVIALLGILYYALLSWNVLFPPDFPYFGTDIYDRYFLAILNGHLDLPARVLRYEGHYFTDGTGYLYHGLAPLLTRFAFGWFVDLPNTSLASLSLWIWTVSGTALYHLSFAQVIRKVGQTGRYQVQFQVIIAVAIWFASPGPFIAMNQSLFHEPIAVSYAMVALAVFSFSRLVFFSMPPGRAVILLAIASAVTFHARPHLALGLYLSTGLLCLYFLFHRFRSMAVPVGIAFICLTVPIALYLGINTLKFGNPMTAHGGFQNETIQYGTVFWGLENIETSERAKAFSEHGKFNARRILPNSGLYLLDFPISPVSNKLIEVFEKATSGLGFIRVEAPRLGFLFLWPFWILLATFGVFNKQILRMPALAGLLGLSAGTLMMLSYGTVAFRYRFDLWGIIAFLSVFSLAKVFEAQKKTRNEMLLLVTIIIGLVFGYAVSNGYRSFFTIMPGSLFAEWSHEFCAERAVNKEFDPRQIAKLCAL